jgi:DNA-binding LacI/PurR family transcriptional regulator
MPTMKDVAERSGVSESTVSHVVNNTRFVAARTREKVLKAMRDLDYHGNAHARHLARGHSDFLGLIISDIENPFYPGLIKAFESAALAHGFDVLLCATNYDAGRTQTAFRKMIENKTPGVAVMTSRVEPQCAAILEEHGIASVFLDSGAVGPRKSNIRLDYAKGAREAISCLHNLGHRRFAFIAGPQTRPSHIAYRQAVELALKGLDLTPVIIEGENTVESGQWAAGRLLTQAGIPTAILSSNDLAAIGAMRTMLQSGVRVPGDVSIVGADDIPFASLTTPPLTTVRIPRERLGELAFETLRVMLDEQGTAGQERLVETELVVRESTGVAPCMGGRPSPTPMRGRAKD